MGNLEPGGVDELIEFALLPHVSENKPRKNSSAVHKSLNGDQCEQNQRSRLNGLGAAAGL